MNRLLPGQNRCYEGQSIADEKMPVEFYLAFQARVERAAINDDAGMRSYGNAGFKNQQEDGGLGYGRNYKRNRKDTKR